MIDEILKYRGALKKASEELEEGGYTVNIRAGGRNVLRIGKVKSKSYFGMLGSVEVVDMKKALEIAKELHTD